MCGAKAASEAKADEIQAVYGHYLEVFGDTPATYKLTDKRRDKIATRLNEFEASALMAAIDACAADDWLERGNFRDLANHIFRSEEQVETWLRKGAKSVKA